VRAEEETKGGKLTGLNPDPPISDQIKERYRQIQRDGLALLLHEGASSDLLSKVSRYEASLMNAFTRTLQQLHMLRAVESDGKAI
jgi:hypothetical protein